MDLNQLYFDHQLLRMRADRAKSCGVQREHERGAARIAARIAGIQRAQDAAAAPIWESLVLAGHSSPRATFAARARCAA